MSITLTSDVDQDQEFVDEVRLAMGKISQSRIPKDTILQQRDRLAIPYLENRGVSGSSKAIDTAVIMLTAEYSFESWLKKKRMRSGELSINLDVEGYRKELVEQSQTALANIGIAHQPSKGPASFTESTDGWFA